jgi:O-antigen/teichoic acid export membrane protein
MGIIQNQSFKNTLITYIGFAFGAINTLFLYTNSKIITNDYYGLVTVVLSWALILMPMFSFGIHNTVIKFYSSFKSKHNLNTFLTYVLIAPIVIALFFGLLLFVKYESFGDFISEDSQLAKGYLWHIFIVAISLAYFEIFYAWSKVHFKSVFGNFMKEVFHRVCIMLLLIAKYFNWLTIDQFINGIVGAYIARAIIMQLFAFSLRLPVLKFKRLDNFWDIVKYSLLILIAGSVATILLDIDKVMIGKLLEIENAAYYSVAIYIASVIGVPARAMHQIVNPLTAKHLNEGNTSELKKLYRKSSLNLLIISGLIFLLIIINVEQLYKVIPEEFSGGFLIVLLISIAKLFDNILGNNNAILFNSDYYRMVLMLGVVLVILTIVFNIVFIPKFGIEGAAFATFLAIFLYNTSKLIFVRLKFKMHPFSKATFKSLALMAVVIGLFYFWDFPFHPLVNITLKSGIISVLYIACVYKFQLSEDINKLLKPYLPF